LITTSTGSTRIGNNLTLLQAMTPSSSDQRQQLASADP
jgi:hypothetical protein